MINETIRQIDTVEEECNYLKEKFYSKDYLIAIEARDNMRNLLKTVLAIKYYYGLNYYSKRDVVIKKWTTIIKYLSYSE